MRVEIRLKRNNRTREPRCASTDGVKEKDLKLPDRVGKIFDRVIHVFLSTNHYFKGLFVYFPFLLRCKGKVGDITSSP